jgi:plasmid stabilization system protein ParE
MAEVILLRGAESDLVELYALQFKQSALRAKNFSRAVDRTIADLASFPELGSLFVGLLRRKLITGHYDYSVFYTLETGRVMIHGVFDL